LFGCASAVEKTLALLGCGESFRLVFTTALTIIE
jgi:hypothetical protein